MSDDNVVYHVYDGEGAPLVDESGRPIAFCDYDKAEKAQRNCKRGKGPISPVHLSDQELLSYLRPSTKPAEPTPDSAAESDSLTDLERAYLEVVGTATKAVRKAQGALDPTVEKAHVAMETLREIGRRRKHLYTITLVTVVEIAEFKLHLVMGHSTVGDFMLASGMKKNYLFYELKNIGDHVVPFLNEQGVDIAGYIGPRTAPKLLAASSVLAKAVKQGDTGKVEKILDDVQNATGRDAIRAKYNNPAKAKGLGYSASSGESVVYVIIVDKGEEPWLKGKLGNKVAWDLMGSVAEYGTSIRIDVSP